MLFRISFLIVTILFVLNANAQISLNISVDESVKQSGDTIKTCFDEVEFTAKALYPDGTIVDDVSVTYKWDMGDGTKIEGKGTEFKTVSHRFKTGAYYVKLNIEDGYGEKAYTHRPLFTTIKQKFEGTKSDFETICKWDKVILTAGVKSEYWKHKLSESDKSASLLISNVVPIKRNINFRLFNYDAKIEKAEDISSVSVELEHADAGSLDIRLECPSGVSVILKQATTDKVVAGEPLINPKEKDRGKTYHYSWQEKESTYKKMQDEAGIYTFNYTDVEGNEHTNITYFPEGSYSPVESFSRLKGCPLNGDWKIIVVDNNKDINGYFGGWTLDTSDKLESGMWQFSITYDNYNWEGGNISSTDYKGVAFDEVIKGYDKEREYGELNYTLSVMDNFGCKHKKKVQVTVQKPKIFEDKKTGGEGKGDNEGKDGKKPEGVHAPVTLNFRIDESVFNWGKEFIWDMGDGEEETGETVSHEYTEGEAPEPRIYTVILKAESEQACIDTDTIEVKILAPESEFEVPNVVMRNGIDGNGVFKIKMKKSTNQLASFDCRIYNRWGKLLYKFTDWENGGWDCRINGRSVPEGVYFYVIKAEGKDKKVYKRRDYTGFFHIYEKK